MGEGLKGDIGMGADVYLWGGGLEGILVWVRMCTFGGVAGPEGIQAWVRMCTFGGGAEGDIGMGADVYLCYSVKTVFILLRLTLTQG